MLWEYPLAGFCLPRTIRDQEAPAASDGDLSHICHQAVNEGGFLHLRNGVSWQEWPRGSNPRPLSLFLLSLTRLPALCCYVVDIWNCRFVTLGMDGWEETQRRERKEHRSHVVAVFLEGICGVCGHLAILAKEVLSSNFFFSLSYQYWTVYVFGFSGNWTEFSCDHSSGTQFCQQILKNTLAYP